jgi:hypothetical protein
LKRRIQLLLLSGTGYWSDFPSGGMSPTSLVNKNPMFVDATVWTLGYLQQVLA